MVGRRWIYGRIRKCGEVDSDVLLFDTRSTSITWSVHIAQLGGGLGPLCTVFKAVLMARGTHKITWYGRRAARVREIGRIPNWGQ